MTSRDKPLLTRCHGGNPRGGGRGPQATRKHGDCPETGVWNDAGGDTPLDSAGCEQKISQCGTDDAADWSKGDLGTAIVALRAG